MKKFTCIIIMAICVFFSVNVLASSKYDAIKEDVGIKRAMIQYDTNIINEPMIMAYLNAIVKSPSSLYNDLVEFECDKEILDFVEENKLFSMKLIHIMIVLHINSIGMNEGQFLYATNFINSDKYMAATNQQEAFIELAVMRGNPYFRIYESFAKPGGMKMMVESIISGMVK